MPYGWRQCEYFVGCSAVNNSLTTIVPPKRNMQGLRPRRGAGSKPYVPKEMNSHCGRDARTTRQMTHFPSLGYQVTKDLTGPLIISKSYNTCFCCLLRREEMTKTWMELWPSRAPWEKCHAQQRSKLFGLPPPRRVRQSQVGLIPQWPPGEKGFVSSKRLELHSYQEPHRRRPERETKRAKRTLVDVCSNFEHQLDWWGRPHAENDTFSCELWRLVDDDLGKLGCANAKQFIYCSIMLNNH